MTSEAFAYRTVVLPGGQVMAYIDEGEGPPLLLLHGFPGTAGSHFDRLISHWRSRYRVIAPDLAGYGRSQPPARDLTPGFYQRDAQDMATLLECLDVPSTRVLGFSDGGESALLLAARAPDRVRAVVAWGVGGVISSAMLAAVGPWLPVEAWGEERLAWREEIIRLHGAHQFPALVEGWVASAQAIYDGGGNLCLAEAAEIRCPALLLNGDADEGNAPRDLFRLAAGIPHAAAYLVPQSGHAIHRDQFSGFCRVVDAFLDRVEAASLG